MEKVKTVKDLDPPYSREFQKTLDNFVRQVDNIFLAKLLTYVTEQDKCRYVGDFLHGILADNWKAYDHWNLKIDNPQYTYAELKLMLQERLLPRHIRQVNVTIKLKLLFQQNNQLVDNLIAHLKTLKRQLKLRPTEIQWHTNLLCAMYTHICNAFI